MDKDLVQGAAVGDLRKVQVCSFCASPKQQKRTKTLKKIREGRKYFVLTCCLISSQQLDENIQHWNMCFTIHGFQETQWVFWMNE